MYSFHTFTRIVLLNAKLICEQGLRSLPCHKPPRMPLSDYDNLLTRPRPRPALYPSPAAGSQ